MPAGLTSTQQIPNAIDRRIKKHFLDTYPTVAPKLEVLFKVETQEDLNEYEQDYQGLGQYEVTAEGETYKMDGVGEGFQTVYTPVKYTKRVSLTKEGMQWDKSSLTSAENMGSEMAKAAADTVEQTAANIFNRGFNTSYTSYGDAKPLFSTDHTRPDGGSAQSNASSSGLALTNDGLETIVTNMRNQKNKRGRLVRSIPRILLVPPALEAEARRITGSNQRSGTANNDTNVFMMSEYAGGSIKVVVWEYLSATMGGSDTAFFVLDDKLSKVTWKWADKPSVRKDDTTGKQNDTLFYLGMFYGSYGWSDWVGTYGSKGDTNTYSS